jgi:hypothetical protein
MDPLVEPAHTAELYKEGQCFQWTKHIDGHTKERWRLVAQRRLAAGGLEMGGLGIPNPDETIRKFQQKLIQ